VCAGGACRGTDVAASLWGGIELPALLWLGEASATARLPVARGRGGRWVPDFAGVAWPVPQQFAVDGRTT
jgi:hypothetical protein